MIVAGLFLAAHVPFPNDPARESIGELKVIETSEGLLTYRKSGFGPCVILFPSAGREASDFNELNKTLNSKGYKTLSIDPGGIGDSGIGLSETSYSAAFTIHAANAYDCDYEQPTVLIGHAYGNRVVRYNAFESQSLGGFDVSYLDRPTGNANIKAVILLAAGGQVNMEPEAEQSLRNIFNPMKSHKSRMKDVSYAFFAEGNDIPNHWTRGWHTKTAIAQGKAVVTRWEDTSWHCAGGVPMLIIQPMQDRIAPIENAYTLRDKCPQEVEIVEIQNAGHALLPEQPDAVAEAVLAFLAKHHPAK
jgi:pimeloyl-ACP methyl ester carboxylesterase